MQIHTRKFLEGKGLVKKKGAPKDINYEDFANEILLNVQSATDVLDRTDFENALMEQGHDFKDIQIALSILIRKEKIMFIG